MGRWSWVLFLPQIECTCYLPISPLSTDFAPPPPPPRKCKAMDPSSEWLCGLNSQYYNSSLPVATNCRLILFMIYMPVACFPVVTFVEVCAWLGMLWLGYSCLFVPIVDADFGSWLTGSVCCCVLVVCCSWQREEFTS